MKTLSDLIDEKAKKLFKSQNPDIEQKSVDIFKEELSIRIGTRIPKRYKDSDIDDSFLIEKIMESLTNKKGIYFYGSAGTGKTHILYALLKRARIIGMEVEMWNLPEKLSELKSFYSNNDRGQLGESSITDEIKTTSILFIDDFGAEKVTEWNGEIMYRLINHRYENMMQTFFASNLSLQELSEKSGDRVVSRIAEMCDIINIDGEDKRLKK